MAKALKETLVDIADAIREKNTSAGQMTSQEMPTKIREIQTGGGGEVAPYDINHFYPAKFTFFSGTDEELAQRLKAGGTEGKYTNMNNMFSNDQNITTIPAIDTKNVTNMQDFFYNDWTLTTVPLFDTSKVTNASGMFFSCGALTSIPAFDFSSVTNARDVVRGCAELKKIHIKNINCDFDISWSTKFTREALVEIIGNLVTQPNPESPSKTLKMLYANSSKLTEEDKAIATAKGWKIQ